jgi:hypothetical protein
MSASPGAFEQQGRVSAEHHVPPADLAKWITGILRKDEAITTAELLAKPGMSQPSHTGLRFSRTMEIST